MHDTARYPMSDLDEVLASPEWAFTLAATLEQQLGDDRILTVGSARDTVGELVGAASARAVALNFTVGDGPRGMIALVAVAAFAETLERAASDEIMLTPCATALDAAVRAIGEQAVVDVESEAAREIEPEVVGDELGDGDLVVYPVLDGGELLGCVVLHLSSSSAPTAPTPTRIEGGGASNAAAHNGGPAGASYVLADVEMGVTAELGRCRMTVRELLSITPGAVIDLDRAAGAPVDVLVNGTLIARGEVVVIDEEFGIRISELIPQPAAAR
jgi:flagellar motor switch protein FliN/FliY